MSFKNALYKKYHARNLFYKNSKGKKCGKNRIFPKKFQRAESMAKMALKKKSKGKKCNENGIFQKKISMGKKCGKNGTFRIKNFKRGKMWQKWDGFKKC